MNISEAKHCLVQDCKYDAEKLWEPDMRPRHPSAFPNCPASRPGEAELFAATCQVSADRGAAGFDAVVGIPDFVSDEITVPTT